MPQVLTAPVAAQPNLTTASHRIDAIDFLRGLVMVIMALDHTRDFFHVNGMNGDPTDLATTTPILFFTRWITHFCAPVFVFLAGTSAWFQSSRKSKKELSSFLIKRGLWLILVEVTIVTFSFTFDPGFHFFGLQTIWAIGISMVVLGGMIWLPFPAILAVGLLIVFGHNALDYYERGKTDFSWWYSLLHVQNFQPLGGGRFLGILYPMLSWSGLMLLGYCFGKLFTGVAAEKRKGLFIKLGLGIVLFFVALRWTNTYGNAEPWMEQKNGLFTLMSFLNTRKYPPSLLYMCMTIGPAILFLAFAKGRSKLAQIITVYGRVPFFYYILHFYLIHLISGIMGLTRGHSLAEGVHGGGDLFAPNFIYPGEGYSLGVVYLFWIAIVAMLYPLCKWFSEYKRTHRQWWLSYI
jgi:uncharacterized membrane protein